MAETLEILIVAKDKASSTIKSIGGTMSSAFKVGAIGAGVGLTALGVGLAGVISLGMEGERVQAQLNAVLESTGGIAGVTAEEANALADSLSRVTTYSADSVIETQSLLLTFTNIGENVMPRATETVLDMATALGTDTKGASIQLGKALNDPIKGVSALSEVGVNFTEQQKEQIKAMVEAGDIAGAQTIILDELGKEFGNSARAAGDTFGGKLTILQNKLVDVVETIGMKMMPTLSDFVDVLIDDLLPQAEELGEWIFPRMVSALEDIADAVTPVVEQFLSFAEDVIIPFVQDHFPAIRNAILAVGALFAGAAILGGILAMGAAIAALTNPITLIVLAVAALAAAWTEDWGGIRTTFQPILEDIADWLGDKIPIAIEAMKVAWDETLLPAFQDAKDFWDESLEPVFSDVVDFIADKIPLAIDLFKLAWDLSILSKLGEFKTFWDENLEPIFSDFVDELETNIPTAITALKTIWDDKLMPALNDLKDFWNDDLKPVVEEITTELGSALALGIVVGKNAINDIGDALDDLIQPIKDVITEIGNLTDKVGTIESYVPDWLIPGSPTPFEIGWRGIASAMRDANTAAANTGSIFGSLQQSNPLLAGGTANYNLTINSNAQSEDLRNDFNTMRVWGGL